MAQTQPVPAPAPLAADMSNASVEQLFQRLSIKEVQTLSKTYQQDALTAKQDLQHLVSTKYRDLIAITDEVADTYYDTKALEALLTDLAYQESRFIGFNTTNSYSKLNSSILKNQADLTRSKGKTRILDTVLHKTLLHLDTNIKTGLPVVHTSLLIHYAKIYYILGVKFGAELESNKLFHFSYNAMKQNLNRYLTMRIATYNVLSNSIYAADSDKYDENQGWGLANVVSKVPLNPMTDETFDLEVDTAVPDADPSLPERFNTNTLPIVNYLVAYIILNSENGTLSRSNCLFDFLQVRYDHLKEVLGEIDVADSSIFNRVNFFHIFRYIETTLGYISDYFESDPNPLVRQLTSGVKTWDLNTILGFPNWFTETLRFNIDLVAVKLPKSSLEDLGEYKFKYITLVCDFFKRLTAQNLDGSSEEVARSLVLFNNMIVGLKKTESWCVEYGFKCQLAQLVASSTSNIATECLHSISHRVGELYKSHASQLHHLDQNILSYIKSRPEKTDLSLFSSDFVGLINEDLSSYFDHVSQASMNPSFSFEPVEKDVVKKLNVWFHDSFKYFKLLSSEKTSGPFDLSLLCEYLQKPVDLAQIETKWGKFGRKMVLEEFETVLKSVKSVFWGNISELLDELIKAQEQFVREKELEGGYEVVKVMLVLWEKTDSFDSNESGPVSKQLILSKLESSLLNAYKFILQTVPELDGISFYDQFEAVIQSPDPSDSPTAPSLKLSTLMFSFASKLLNPTSNHTDDYKNGMIFFDTKKLFQTQKNEWIKDLIGKCVTKEKLSKNAALQLYANMSFLGCFNSEDSVVRTEGVKEVLEEEVGEIEFKEVSKRVKEFYEASRGTYYPL